MNYNINILYIITSTLFIYTLIQSRSKMPRLTREHDWVLRRPPAPQVLPSRHLSLSSRFVRQRVAREDSQRTVGPDCQPRLSPPFPPCRLPGRVSAAVAANCEPPPRPPAFESLPGASPYPRRRSARWSPVSAVRRPAPWPSTAVWLVAAPACQGGTVIPDWRCSLR